MSTTNFTSDNRQIPSASHDHSMDRMVERDRQIDNAKDKSLERTVETNPLPDAWKTIVAGTVAPVVMAAFAAFVTYGSQFERVAITAWIAVTVVGTASVIAAACVSRRRIGSVDRTDQGTKEISKIDGMRRQNIH